jgi:hypothetical protein
VNEETAVIVVEDAPAPLTDQERALVAVGGADAAGTLAIATLTQEQFDARLKALVLGKQRIAQIQRALMVPEVDYGVIPGTKNPSLLKPGAEKLLDFYNLRAAFVHTRTVGDGESTPAVHYQSRCDLHLGSLEGPIIAQGYGTASTHEEKHRWRTGSRVCPNCGKQAIIKGAEEYGGGWLCWKKKDGCGTKWTDGDPAIESQSVERVENPDPHSLDNTLIKMSEKRALIDATLRATAASGLFTQDVEPPPHSASGEPGAPQPQATTRSQSASPGGGGGTGNGSAAAGGTFTGKVVTAPDRVREKPRPEWVPGPPTDQVPTAELKFEVETGNGRKSKHTAILVNDAAYVVRDAQLQEGDEVRVMGELNMVEWEKGKPKMRQLWRCTSVERAGPGPDDWRHIWQAGEAEADTVLVADESINNDALVGMTEEDADRMSRAHVIEGDYTEVAANIFGADAAPAKPLDEMLALPRATGTGDFDGTLTLLKLTEKVTTGTKKRYLELILTDKRSTYIGAMEGSEADAQNVAGTYDTGSIVRVVGTWFQGGIAVTAITAPA